MEGYFDRIYSVLLNALVSISMFFLKDWPSLFKRFWPWIAGLGILLTAVIFWGGTAFALKMREGELRTQLLELRSHAREFPLSKAVSFDLRGKLSSKDRISTIAGELQSLASEAGLSLTDAAYQPQETVGDIGRVGINVNMKGAYPSLKKAVATLLGLHEGLALDAVSLRRSRSTDTMLDMAVRFSFYYRKAA